MEKMKIVFNGVNFSYLPGVPILEDVNLELENGLTLLLGPNGTGKSTFLKMAAGIEMCEKGKILINGYDLWKEEVLSRRNLVYVPEQPDLTPYATVKEILDLVCRVRNEKLEKAKEMVKRSGLEGLERRTVRELSMGQRRRAVFAAAWIGNSHIILLDEPMEGLDRRIQTTILEWIQKKIQMGALGVIVSHDVSPYVSLTSQGLTIVRGKMLHFKNLPPDNKQKKRFLEKLAEGRVGNEGSIIEKI
ncbi:MAG: ABC transporter ATP-binding protein [Candidatus Aminicenantes bacterium]|nr:ABC transporter ATP-binding protein [Candidatus Aminicenantes bacterium]